MSRNTIARINLAAIRHNLDVVRHFVPHSKVVCVVKADAYGHGLSRVCQALEDADVLAVATISEGFNCREQGWTGRLLLLEGPSNLEEFKDAVSMGAEMVVHHDNQLQLLRNNPAMDTETLWLKVDSGMHRLGFAPAEVKTVFAELTKLQKGRELILMSHFACADDPANPMTMEQVAIFDQAIVNLNGSISLANSAAILNFRQTHRDYVRPGIMLYGVSPCADKVASDIGLLPVMTLSCELIAVKNVCKGESIGYGAAYRCDRDLRIGVAAIGYGDGYPRHARNGTPVLVNGRRASLAGRVSMDMVTIDLSGHAEARVGDPVTLWGEGLPLEEVALWADAIPYELICGVTARVTACVEDTLVKI